MYEALHRTSRWRGTRLPCWTAILAAACVFPVTGAALDRDVTLRFLPPADSQVTGYRVYSTEVESQVEYVIDVGFVASDADGVGRKIVTFDAERSYLVAMTAYNATGESPLSNAIQIPRETSTCDPALCDDGRPCTADSCDASGCFQTPLAEGSHCDDGYIDTVDDQCLAGVCEGVLLACREDFDCDDGNVCNGLETCDGGIACLEGTPLECGALTPCATPFCDPQLGCTMVFEPDETPCDDRLATTTGDVCLAGVCQGTPGIPHPSVDSVSPQAIGPGDHTLTVYGGGFSAGAVLSFQNGRGPAPRVRALELFDQGMLEVRLEVSRNGPRKARFWDVVVTLPDGPQARLPAGLRIDR